MTFTAYLLWPRNKVINCHRQGSICCRGCRGLTPELVFAPPPYPYISSHSLARHEVLTVALVFLTNRALDIGQGLLYKFTRNASYSHIRFRCNHHYCYRTPLIKFLSARRPKPGHYCAPNRQVLHWIRVERSKPLMGAIVQAAKNLIKNAIKHLQSFLAVNHIDSRPFKIQHAALPVCQINVHSFFNAVSKASSFTCWR